MLHLAIFTNFPDRNVMAAGRPVAPADLALDLDGNGRLETGVVLSSVPSPGDKGVVRAANIRKATAYKVKKWLRPDDILEHTYGQGWRWVGLTGQELAYAAVPIWVGEGTRRDDLMVTVDWRVNGRGSDHVVYVTLTRTNGNGELWNLPVIWGTAVCGNDVVFAPIARLGDLVTKADADEKGDENEDQQGANEEGVGDEELIANGGLGVGVETANAGEAKEGEETISEGVSEGSDEDLPTWNETYPVAFPESTGESTVSGGGGSGSSGSSSSSSGGGSEGMSTGGGSGGGGGGGDPENPLAPDGEEGEEGGGEEGGGGIESATQVPEPPVTWLPMPSAAIGDGGWP